MIFITLYATVLVEEWVGKWVVRIGLKSENMQNWEEMYCKFLIFLDIQNIRGDLCCYSVLSGLYEQCE